MSGPPFDRYPVASSTIRDQAAQVSGSKKRIVAVQNAMDKPRKEAADAVDGQLDGSIEGPANSAQQQAMRTAKGANLCSGAIELYATYVDIFNLGVDDLNAEWQTAKEHDFGVPMGGDSDGGDREEDVEDARGEKAKELRKKYREIENDLDEGAENVARVLNAGPDAGERNCQGLWIGVTRLERHLRVGGVVR